MPAIMVLAVVDQVADLQQSIPIQPEATAAKVLLK
jgi:hypothetical protein